MASSSKRMRTGSPQSSRSSHMDSNSPPPPSMPSPPRTPPTPSSFNSKLSEDAQVYEIFKSFLVRKDIPMANDMTVFLVDEEYAKYLRAVIVYHENKLPGVHTLTKLALERGPKFSYYTNKLSRVIHGHNLQQVIRDMVEGSPLINDRVCGFSPGVEGDHWQFGDNSIDGIIKCGMCRVQYEMSKLYPNERA